MREDQGRRAKRMDRIDRMKPDIRACVHDFGLSIVDACLDHGVTTARGIRHIVQSIRGGSYQSVCDGKMNKNVQGVRW